MGCDTNSRAALGDPASDAVLTGLPEKNTAGASLLSWHTAHNQLFNLSMPLPLVHVKKEDHPTSCCLGLPSRLQSSAQYLFSQDTLKQLSRVETDSNLDSLMLLGSCSRNVLGWSLVYCVQLSRLYPQQCWRETVHIRLLTYISITIIFQRMVAEN